MPVLLRALIIEDNPADAELLARELSRAGFALEYRQVDRAAALQTALQEAEWDVVLCDFILPHLRAQEALDLIRQSGLDLPFIIVSGTVDEETAVESLRAGAHDFISKNRLARLAPAITREMREAAVRRDQRASQERYRQMFQKNRAVQLVIDLQSGMIVDANPAAAEFYGYDLATLRGMPVDRIEVPGATQFAGLAEGATVTRHQTATGQARDVEVHTSQVAASGAVHLYAIVNDISGLRRRERELEALAAVAAALRTAPSRAEMSPVILDQLLAVLEVQSAALALWDAASAELFVEAARGWVGPVPRRLPGATSSLSRAVATGQPYWNNAAGEEDELAWVDLPERLAAVACVPLVAHERVLGALWIGSVAPLTPGQVSLLTAIGDMAANALRRAALHEQTEQRLRRLGALRAIDMAITTSLDLRLTLNVVLDQVAMQLGMDAAAVMMLHAASQTLAVAAARGLPTEIDQGLWPISLWPVAQRAVRERQTVHVPDVGRTTEPVFPQVARRALSGFRAYHVLPLVAKGQVKGVLSIFHRTPIHPDPESLAFLESLAGQAAIAVDNATLFEALQRSNLELSVAYDATIEGWSRALDLRDRETEGHTQRVTQLTLTLAHAAGMPDDELVHIRRGSLLHDIGKMGIPDQILLKPGPLTDDEWVIMRQHPVYAHELLAPINFLRPALDIPYCHHEKWDGSGYPRALSGDQIPLPARLFAVADVWDALRSDRPYRPAWSEAEALDYLRRGSGHHFDARAVALFMRVVGHVT